MIRLGEEYRAQLVLSALQCALIVGGTFLVGAFAKVTLNMGVNSRALPMASVHFIRYFGISLLLMPLAWTIFTILAERSEFWWATRRFTLATGILLLCILAAFFSWVVHTAAVQPYHDIGPIQPAY